MDKCSVHIYWSVEDGGYVARIPKFPNLLAVGDTHEEALQEAKDALKGMCEVMEEDLVEDEPEEVEVPVPLELIGGELYTATSEHFSYNMNGCKVMGKHVTRLPGIKGFARFTWPDWVEENKPPSVRDDTFRLWKVSEAFEEDNATLRTNRTIIHKEEVLATGALFLDYGEEE